MIRIWITLAIMGFLGIIGWLGWSIYKDNQTQLRQLAEERARLEVIVNTQEETINQIQQWSEQQDVLIQQLREGSAEAEKAIRRLRGILAEHNLTKLATRKPGLIEKRINEATREIFRSIECDTGAC